MTTISSADENILSKNTNMIIKKSLLNEIKIAKEGSVKGDTPKTLFFQDSNEIKIGSGDNVVWGGEAMTVTGNKGQKGEQGAKNTETNKGEKGSIGAQGETGEASGVKGNKGINGEDWSGGVSNGETGEQIKGEKGSIGNNFNGFDFASDQTQSSILRDFVLSGSGTDKTLEINNKFIVTGGLEVTGTATQVTNNQVSMTDKIIDLNTDGGALPTDGQGIEVNLSGVNQKMQWNGSIWKFKNASGDLQNVRAGEIEIGKHDSNDGGRLNFSDGSLSIQYLSTATSPNITDDGLFIVKNNAVHVALGVFDR